MFGLIGKIETAPGQRTALIEILLEGTKSMPGCLSYIIAEDSAESNDIWITEVWESEEKHKASLSLPAVQSAIARGKPLIVGFAEQFRTKPIGGYGLPG